MLEILEMLEEANISALALAAVLVLIAVR